jgi:hypothetical protein
MGLVLSLAEEDRVWIKDRWLKVEQIFDDGDCVASVGGKMYQLTDHKGEEVAPDVFVHAGFLANNPSKIRLLFEADRSIEILREEKYREKYGPDTGKDL